MLDGIIVINTQFLFELAQSRIHLPYFFVIKRVRILEPTLDEHLQVILLPCAPPKVLQQALDPILIVKNGAQQSSQSSSVDPFNTIDVVEVLVELLPHLAVLAPELDRGCCRPNHDFRADTAHGHGDGVGPILRV